MKLCVNCKHFNQNGFPDKCNHPNNKRGIHPVNGVAAYGETNCYWHRSVPIILDIVLSACGKRGRWYEPKGDEDEKV